MIKFIVPSQLLSKNLQNISGIVSTNNSVPIVENLLFTIEDSLLHITATDLETTMTTQLELSSCEGSGSVVIPTKLVIETVKNLPDVPVSFFISEDYKIEISADGANCMSVGYAADQFPKAEELADATTFEVPADFLYEAITKTSFATGNAELRPVMAGIFCQIDPESITFVATDAHRLVKYQNKDIHLGIENSFILPKKPLLQLKNVLQNTDKNVKVAFNNSNVYFSIETLTIISKLIDGKYPNYEAVIPKNNTNILQVERLLFLQKIKYVVPYANQSTHLIRMKMTSSELTLTAEDTDYSNKATVTFPCTYEGEGGELEIGFSSRLLQEMLNNIDTENVVFQFSHATAAGLIFPIEDNAINENILMLAMPVMLQD